MDAVAKLTEELSREAGLWADKKAQERVEADLRNPKPKTEEEELLDMELDGGATQSTEFVDSSVGCFRRR
eukprot:14987930-Heterocapsa_arctica.AAC.1